MQKKQCRQNSALIRLRFREGTTLHQDSCSMAKTLFGKKQKKQENQSWLKMLQFVLLFNNSFVFPQKVAFRTIVGKQLFFKEILPSQILKWENNLGEKKSMLKKLPSTKKNRVYWTIAKNCTKSRPLLNQVRFSLF